MNHNLERIIKFFKFDLQVKKILNDSVPRQEYIYDSEQYSKILYKSIDYIEYYIDSMLNLFSISDSDYSKQFFNNLRLKVDGCCNDFYKLKDLYIKYFSSMRTELLSKVADECVGYKILGRTGLKCAQSINEFLHIIHQNVINDEEIYKKMPKIYGKKNSENNDVTLYGENSILATNIYNAFPFELSSGDVDIISFDNQFLIMVRDRGHALSIEIGKNTDDDTYFVNYFIPKICNVDMINRLRGVTRVSSDSKYTRGIFRTTADELPFDLVDLIEKVPMDEHMYIEGGKYYTSGVNENIR